MIARMKIRWFQSSSWIY